jgi:hypothetical protein
MKSLAVMGATVPRLPTKGCNNEDVVVVVVDVVVDMVVIGIVGIIVS